ncbi:MAG TPA: ABATE domain-containing protein [Planctomycetota bacterium]|nr:ABATE domain-containing protein [Planctomycetota bacterium]
MTEPRFLFLEGNPAWLDFVNTKFILGGTLVDRLETYPDLLDWLVMAGLLEPGKTEAAARAWSGTTQAREALHHARKLRQTLHTAAEPLWKTRVLAPAAVRSLNQLLASGGGFHRLVEDGTGYALKFESDPRRAVQLLEPLARSTAAFLAGADFGRVRKCGNEKCVLYFYDTTKNQARRWCSMALCGNRLKAAAHYQRMKGLDRS